jgi:hypothetical protein
MTHYSTDASISSYQVVPLDMIGITKPIKLAIKTLNGTISENHPIDYNGPSFGKLNRLECFKDFSNLKLPPIKVKFNGLYYEIIDGRHRVALSLAYNMTSIPIVL